MMIDLRKPAQCAGFCFLREIRFNGRLDKRVRSFAKRNGRGRSLRRNGEPTQPSRCGTNLLGGGGGPSKTVEEGFCTGKEMG